MISLAATIFFNDKNFNTQRQFLFAVLFPFFTIFALGIDSIYFQNLLFDGRQITNYLTISYFALFFWFSSTELRRLMFLMLFLSYLGEIIFCSLLHFYDYKTVNIPLYVPFGHAIVYASGYVCAHTNWALRNETALKKYFALGFVSLFLFVGLFLNDLLSVIFGVFFFLLLKRKKWQNLYYFIAVCVIFIELTGTYFQCWKWKPQIYSIPTLNPPMGAVFLYAGGDVLLSKITGYWKEKN